MRKKLILIILFIVSLYLIVYSVKDILGILKKKEEIKKEQLKLERLKAKNEELKKQLEYVKTPEFIEKEAREKLNLARPGEVVVILPENVSEIVDIGKEQKPSKEEKPNWKKWLNLFFPF